MTTFLGGNPIARLASMSAWFAMRSIKFCIQVKRLCFLITEKQIVQVARGVRRCIPWARSRTAFEKTCGTRCIVRIWLAKRILCTNRDLGRHLQAGRSAHTTLLILTQKSLTLLGPKAGIFVFFVPSTAYLIRLVGEGEATHARLDAQDVVIHCEHLLQGVASCNGGAASALQIH